MLATMKLNEGRSGAAQLIRRYGAQGVTIGTQEHPLPVLVCPNAVVTGFDSNRLQELAAADLQRIFASRPAIVLAGSASGQWFPPAAVRHAFEAQRIALESMEFGAACRTFNVLVQEDREVVALLFP